MPTFHPEQDLLVEYACGALHEPGSLVVATHLALCPQCRAAAGSYEAVGGAILDELDPIAMAPGALDAILGRLDEPAPREEAPRGGHPGLPEPLRSYLGIGLDEVPWKTRFGIAEYDLGVGQGPIRTFLIKLPAGGRIPVHTHRGRELTLVLTGAFTDCLGTFEPGDFVALTGETEHQPVVRDDADCICLAVTDAPLKLTGLFGRLLNPFLK